VGVCRNVRRNAVVLSERINYFANSAMTTTEPVLVIKRYMWHCNNVSGSIQCMYASKLQL